jgi:hypothetical protein
VTTYDRIIRSLVYSASGRFSACEAKEDFEEQQRLYEELLRERVEELVALRMAKEKGHHKTVAD